MYILVNMDGGWPGYGTISCGEYGLFVQKSNCYRIDSKMSACPECGRSHRQKPKLLTGR